MRYGILISIVTVLFLGCGETGIKDRSQGVGAFGTKASPKDTLNKETLSLQADDLTDYIFENKDAKLNASDCLKFSGQDWSNMYRDAIYVMAPADSMAKSINACSKVMFGVESGYSLEQMSRSPISDGFLNGIVEAYDYTPTSHYIPHNQQMQNSIDEISQMTLSECRQKYGYFNSKNEITQAILDLMVKETESSLSQSEFDRLELQIAELSHCDDLLFGD